MILGPTVIGLKQVRVSSGNLVPIRSTENHLLSLFELEDRKYALLASSRKSTFCHISQMSNYQMYNTVHIKQRKHSYATYFLMFLYIINKLCTTGSLCRPGRVINMENILLLQIS